MSIGLRPPHIHWGTYVIPKNHLVGHHNQKGRIQRDSTPFLKEGMKLLAEGKENKARRTFLRMFDCTELNAVDFAAAGNALTDPATSHRNLRLDMFAKKFFKQAVILGSNDPKVYERLALQYLKQDRQYKAEPIAMKLKALAPDSPERKRLFVQLYASKQFPIDDEKIDFALSLLKDSTFKTAGHQLLLTTAFQTQIDNVHGRTKHYTQTTTPIPGWGYRNISHEKRAEMATFFFHKIHTHITTHPSGKPVTPATLLADPRIKADVIALAVMSEEERGSKREIIHRHMAQLGVNSREVIQQASTRENRFGYFHPYHAMPSVFVERPHSI